MWNINTKDIALIKIQKEKNWEQFKKRKENGNASLL